MCVCVCVCTCVCACAHARQRENRAKTKDPKGAMMPAPPHPACLFPSCNVTCLYPPETSLTSAPRLALNSPVDLASIHPTNLL